MRYTLGPEERAVRYNVGFPPPPLQEASYAFWLPAVGQTWHWGFYTCNGFSQSVPPEI